MGQKLEFGFGAETRWRLLDRKISPFDLTLQLESSASRIDEGFGQAGRKLGSENRLVQEERGTPPLSCC